MMTIEATILAALLDLVTESSAGFCFVYCSRKYQSSSLIEALCDRLQIVTSIVTTPRAFGVRKPLANRHFLGTPAHRTPVCRFGVATTRHPHFSADCGPGWSWWWWGRVGNGYGIWIIACIAEWPGTGNASLIQVQISSKRAYSSSTVLRIYQCAPAVARCVV